MTPAKRQVMFRVRGGDTVEIVSQLLQCTFPNYEQLIPQSYTTRAIMDLLIPPTPKTTSTSSCPCSFSGRQGVARLLPATLELWPAP